MNRIPIVLSSLLLIFTFTGAAEEKQKDPSALTDETLLKTLETASEAELAPLWQEAEKRQKIGLRFLFQDKSGTVVKLFKDATVQEPVLKRYILYRLRKPEDLTNSEKEALFHNAGKYGLKEAVPLILKALEGEKSIGPHISAASAFKMLKAREMEEWLKRNLNKEYLDTLGSGGCCDASQREELQKISEETLSELKTW
jgi:hypothetical protein